MSMPWRRREVIGDQTLYLGDCLEVLPTLGKVDAVVTDPPYGMGTMLRAGNGSSWTIMNNKGTDWDDRPANVDPFILLEVPTIIWGGQFFNLPRQRGWLVWDKIISEFSTSVCELAWTNIEMPVKRLNCASATILRDGRTHPTQKPVALMRWCLGFVPNARTILDPFMGSGTTLVACVREGRRGIGVELDEGYFEIACRRVEEAYRQPDMFVERPAAPVQEAMDL